MTYKIGQKFSYVDRIWRVIKVDKKEVILEDLDGYQCYIDLHSKDPMPEDFKEIVK